MIASEGRVVAGLAARYLDHPFFTAPERRSLDRNDFSPPASGEATLEDGARTLAHVTRRRHPEIRRPSAAAPRRPMWSAAAGELNPVIMARSRRAGGLTRARG